MSIVNIQRIVNCLTKLFLQILNFLFEIAVVRYRRNRTWKQGGLRKRDVWLTALSVSRTTAISRKHSLLRRFSYKQFTGLFALRIAFPEWEAFVRCGRIWNPPLRCWEHFVAKNVGFADSRGHRPYRIENHSIVPSKSAQQFWASPKKVNIIVDLWLVGGNTTLKRNCFAM